MPDYHHPVCKCGSLRWDFMFVRFPMLWAARCAHCGRAGVFVALKPLVKNPPKPRPPEAHPGYWHGF